MDLIPDAVVFVADSHYARADASVVAMDDQFFSVRGSAHGGCRMGAATCSGPGISPFAFRDGISYTVT